MNPAVVGTSAAVAFSVFLPWIEMQAPFGGESVAFTPWMVVEPMFNPPEGRQAMDPASMPPIVWLFFSSFAVSALICLSALLGKARWWEVVLTGAIPFAVVIWAIGGVVVELDRSGLPARDLIDATRMFGVNARSLDGLFSELAKVLGVGFYLHYTAAALLVAFGFTMRESEVTT